MNKYEVKSFNELSLWKKEMTKEANAFGKASKSLQNKINSKIPDKVHETITNLIKKMVETVIAGSELTTKKSISKGNLEFREGLVREKITAYRNIATLSGGGTGAGGLILGLADFPILLSLQIKFLYEIANIYGFDVKNYKERLYILHIFELAFSSDEKRIKVYKKLLKWVDYAKELPNDPELFDWKSFQQEYRDYIDIAKMLQLVPVIGAPVGAIANYRLMNKLGITAMNAYRLRIFKLI